MKDTSNDERKNDDFESKSNGIVDIESSIKDHVQEMDLHAPYYNIDPYSTLSKLHPTKFNQSDTQNQHDAATTTAPSSENPNIHKDGEYHPKSFQRGKIKYPMTIDFFGDQDETQAQSNPNSLMLKNPSVVAFQVDIPKSSGGNVCAQFGSYAIIHSDTKLGASSNHLTVGYSATDQVTIDGSMEIGPKSKVKQKLQWISLIYVDCYGANCVFWIVCLYYI